MADSRSSSGTPRVPLFLHLRPFLLDRKVRSDEGRRARLAVGVALGSAQMKGAGLVWLWEWLWVPLR